jgi:hypothetical protein
MTKLPVTCKGMLILFFVGALQFCAETLYVNDQGAKLWLGNKVVAQLKVDQKVTVTATRGTWYGVSVDTPDGRLSGWVSQKGLTAKKILPEKPAEPSGQTAKTKPEPTPKTVVPPRKADPPVRKSESSD